MFFRVAWAVMEKDLRVELRARESLFVMVVFSVLVLTLFSFAFGPGAGRGGEEAAALQAGILWVAFLFSSVLGLSRSMAIERETEGLAAMHLSPADPSAIFWERCSRFRSHRPHGGGPGSSRWRSSTGRPVEKAAGSLALVAGAATLGIAAVGTLFAAMSVQTRTREVLLPILMFPLLVPVLIAAVKATAALLGTGGWPAAADWFKMLLAFDVIFVVVCGLTFEYLLEE